MNEWQLIHKCYIIVVKVSHYNFSDYSYKNIINALKHFKKNLERFYHFSIINEQKSKIKRGVDILVSFKKLALFYVLVEITSYNLKL